MLETIWDMTVDLHRWMYRITDTVESTTKGDINLDWRLLLAGLFLLIVGGIFNILSSSRSGIPELSSQGNEPSGKDKFMITLAYVLFPVMISWCHFKYWSNVSGFAHFFGWILFIFFVIILLAKVIHVIRLLFTGNFGCAVMKLFSIPMIYCGLVVFSGILGALIVFVFLIVALLSPSRSGGYSGGGSSNSDNSFEYNGTRLTEDRPGHYVDSEGRGYHDTDNGWGRDINRD